MSTGSKYRAVLMFGAPGSGKGTQGKVIGALPGFLHLSMGDVFRSLDKESDLGRIFTEYSSQGKLVPDDVTIELWLAHVNRLIESGGYSPDSDIMILDGLPRNPRQAELIEEHVDPLRLIHLEARDETQMVERLKRRAVLEGRRDDADETVGEKIRRAITQKHPAILVVGDRDVENRTVGLRLREDDAERRGIPLDAALVELVELAAPPR